MTHTVRIDCMSTFILYAVKHIKKIVPNVTINVTDVPGYLADLNSPIKRAISIISIAIDMTARIKTTPPIIMFLIHSFHFHLMASQLHIS